MKTSDFNKLYSQSGIPHFWHDKTFDQFTNDSAALTRVKQYLTEIHNNPIFGIMFNGEAGVGKSHLMMCIAMQIVREGIDVKVTNLSKLMNSITHTFGSPQKHKELLQVVRKHQFMFLEDVGTEFRSELSSKALSFLIKERINIKKPLFIATSLMPKQFAVEYGDSVASLLKEKCVPILVKGDDYRETLFNKNSEKLKE